MDSGQKAAKELTSWKEIAAFLGVSERTAQNWEQKQGLPVQRLPGARGRVLADPAELEEWKKNAVLKRSNGQTAWHASVRFLRRYAILATALGLIAVALVARSYYSAKNPGPLASYRIDIKSLIVTDAAGEEIWRWTSPEPLHLPRYVPDQSQRDPVWLGDIDGDSRTDILLLYDPANRNKAGDLLICFSDRGQEKWRFAPGGEVSDLQRTYSGPFLIANFLVADPNKDGAKEILVTSHDPYYPLNHFAVVNSRGGRVGEYWHSGFLEIIDTWDMDADGIDDILLADVNNGHAMATLVVLDPRQVAGASTQPEGDKSQLQGFELGKEKAVVLFPRSRINRLFNNFNIIGQLVVSRENIRVEVIEKRDDRQCVIAYALDRRLKPFDATPSDRYKEVCRELELAGKLPPFSEDEIEQLKKAIRVIRRQ